MAKKSSIRVRKKMANPDDPPAMDEPKEDQPEAQPRPIDYLRASLGLARVWAKVHKLQATLALAVLAVVATLLVVWLWPSQEQLTNSQIATLVNKTLHISGDANPAILSVEDETRATQPFLEQAENGDKVLLYYNTKKAVLFRPSEKRVVHEGSYTPPPAKVFIRKGTTNDTRINEAKAKLDQVVDVDIVSQDNSPKSDYKGIKLVSVTDRYNEKVKELEGLFGVSVIRLPAGETFPDADIMIIVGG